MREGEYRAFRAKLFGQMWRDLDPLSAQVEESGQIPMEVLRPILTQTRLWGAVTPAEYGGLGLTIRQYLPIIAELSKIHGGIRALVHVHNSMAHAITAVGSEEQRTSLLPGVALGTKSVAFALTEPDHGSGADVGTRAVFADGEFRITGTKHLITNSDFASHFIVFAKTDTTGVDRVTAFLVERNAQGLAIDPLPETLGCRGGEHGRLTFAEVTVSPTSILGREGRGLEQMEEILEISRVLVAASSLGTAERALELSLTRARERVTFGKPIAQRQAVQRYLTEMAMDVYALREMLKDCAAKWDRGQRIPAEASLTKEFGLEAVGRVTDRALLVFGGIGYTRAHPIERLYRDARLNWLEEGTPTIQYSVAARAVLEGKWGRDDW
jgi:alkylation response protein AidB-like acyl-CoA dehydrogenase